MNMEKIMQWHVKAEYHLVLCNCGTPEHQLILVYMPDDDDLDTCYVSVHLTNYEGFFRRLWAGIRYTFGYKSRYREFDEICLNKIEAQALAEYLLKFADGATMYETAGAK